MHLGVQRFDAAVQHLGELRDFGHLVTGKPSLASSWAVPPVESRRMPRACSARANSTMPVLSETEINAFMAVGLSVLNQIGL